MPGAAPVTMFPPRKAKKVPGPKRLMAFRCPEDIAERIDQRHRDGYDKTEVITTMLELARDIEEELAYEDFVEIDYEAKKSKTTRGKVISALVKEALLQRQAKNEK